MEFMLFPFGLHILDSEPRKAHTSYNNTKSLLLFYCINTLSDTEQKLSSNLLIFESILCLSHFLYYIEEIGTIVFQ